MDRTGTTLRAARVLTVLLIPVALGGCRLLPPDLLPDPEPPAAPAPQPPAPPAPPPAPPANPGLSAEEQQLVDLVNQARASEGLAPLTVLEPLTAGARAWSADMAARGVLEHDQLQILPGCRGAGENIAYMSARPNLVQEMFNGWMSSPGHRANILRPEFTALGVGFASKGNLTYGTQRFATC